MTDPTEEFQRELHDVLQRLFDKYREQMPAGSLLTKWVVVVEHIDGDDNRWTSGLNSFGLPRWDRLGLLHHATLITETEIRGGLDDE